MSNPRILAATVAAAIGIGGLATPAPADHLFDFMNPFAWFFGDDDDWKDDYYRYGSYAPGYGWGGPHAWAPPPGYLGYRPSSTVIVLPAETQTQAAVYPE